MEELRNMDTHTLYKDAPRVLLPGDMYNDSDLIPYRSVRELFEHGLENVDFINGQMTEKQRCLLNQSPD